MNIYVNTLTMMLLSTYNNYSNFSKDISHTINIPFSQFTIIDTPQGKIKGYLEYNIHGNKFWSFKGIPYALPPVGTLRFQPPIKFEKWQGVKDTRFSRSICTQSVVNFDDSFNIIIGNEDCLYLNVYTSSITMKKQPVMFWIHGGSYEYGSGDLLQYSPGWIVQKGVILVTINYRLNAFGFFPINDKSLNITGNQGLKDQLLALKWVRDNIEFYGGDPNQVTIFGESTGAGSIGLHLLSKQSKGLFHKAIMQSGSPENFWNIQKSYSIQELQKYFNIKDNLTSSEIKNYLQNLDEKTFFYSILKVREDRRKIDRLVNWFSPNIEFENPDGFIKDYPAKLMENRYLNDVPIILGFNKDEGVVCCLSFWKNILPNFNDPKNYKFVAPPFMNVSKQDRVPIGKKIIDFFCRDSKDEFDCKVKYFSSIFVTYELIQHAKQISKKKKTPTYLYEFDAYTDLNMVQYLMKFDPITYLTDSRNLTSHIDEIGYLFPQILIPFRTNEAKKISEALLNMWTNFAKTSNPNKPFESNLLEEEWLPLKNSEFLRITNQFARMDSDPKKETNDFWDRLKESLL